ncbi:MAG: hypothetical protein OXI46_00055 [Gemmatimonadota bacterium]|nr:hypothetical protein [Gemmatimonadota bacterium]
MKALVGSPEHHESGLGSNAVERFRLDDRVSCASQRLPSGGERAWSKGFLYPGWKG